jgi:hypothetical protein
MWIVHIAGEELDLAGTAVSAATAIRQDHVLPQRRIENRLALADFERPALGLNCDLKFIHELELGS